MHLSAPVRGKHQAGGAEWRTALLRASVMTASACSASALSTVVMLPMVRSVVATGRLSVSSATRR
ncbi:hypothetical protein LAUMK191_02091 [Mycobacterium attenuatum]|nr:hypothetical protein LAUMK191_02091 [Mycobacterium attenuatum]